MSKAFQRTVAIAIFSCTATFAFGQSKLIHYWHFNNLPSGTLTTVNADSSVNKSASQITYPGTGIGYLDNVSPGNIKNARLNQSAGLGLRPRNPSNTRTLLISASTKGFKNVIMKFATARTSSGAQTQEYAYSLDSGNTFITTGLNITTHSPSVEPSYDSVSLDFSKITGAVNNPKFMVRISFTGSNASGTSGNNRFDNISFEGEENLKTGLVHYWHFNNLPSGTLTSVAADSSANKTGAVITYPGTGTGYLDNVSPGNIKNARLAQPAGLGLRPRNPSNTRSLIIGAPTSGFSNMVVRFATARTTSGAQNQEYAYSLDSGSTFITTGLNITTFSPVTEPQYDSVELDFRNISGANNNRKFMVRINFSGAAASGTSGNNRFDNITFEALPPASSKDTTAPIVRVFPANGSTKINTDVIPYLVFNEKIRLLNNSALNDNNADTLIELRLNNISGNLVSMDAYIKGDTIYMKPSSAMLKYQTYFIRLKGNRIEDLNDNVVKEFSSTFTTLAEQTVFSAGDIVPVAYRMNATGVNDEIALLTFVDIKPGTLINLTDAKFTTNMPAQCPGGLLWESPSFTIPAGLVFSIKTDGPSADLGFLSGNSFGLSSGGDQVIIYTGSNTNPTYLTALSSNNWLTANTTCSGSNSMLPSGLTDASTAINFATAKGSVSGNTANSYYAGSQTGTYAQIKARIMDTANWIGAGSGTAPQTWPNWNFPGGAPKVLAASVLSNTKLQIVFDRNMRDSSTLNIGNYSGISNLVQITIKGGTRDTALLTYSAPFANGNSYSLTIRNVRDSQLVPLINPFVYAFTYNTVVNFNAKFASVSENAGTYSVRVNITNPSNGSVKLIAKGTPWSTTGGSDYTFSNQTISIDGNSPASLNFTINITNDDTSEMDEYLVLALEDATGCSVGSNPFFTLFIKDDERKAPVAAKGIELKHVNSFNPVPASGSTCEIAAYDPLSKRLYTTSAIQDRLDILDFSNPAATKLIKSINMAPYGGVTSVAAFNGLIAVASPNANEQLNGSVVFFDTAGNFKKQVTVGALPDMVCFSPNGNMVLTANEGQPNADYSVDPEGSVSLIDLSNGINNLTQTQVTTLGFTSFNSSESSLIASGVRKTKASSTLSQDFEPEFVSVSPDNKTAWVTLQENNAIAEINLETKAVAGVFALGNCDFSKFGNGLDPSDNSGVVTIGNWPLKGFYMPDAIANYTTGNKRYLVMANEGDEKEYINLNERTTVGATTTKLDSTKFPHAALLKENHHLGRFRMTNLNGDTDNDGDFDELYTVGSRSFTIFDASTKAKVFESRDQFELITGQHPTYGGLFNADNENNNFKSRSRAKGPEPEGLVLADIWGRTFAFIGLERTGGVMVYDVTNPANPVYQDYINTRNLTSFGGDLAPEGIIYLPANSSPDGKPYILVANEISGTISVFEIKNNLPPAEVNFTATGAGVKEGSNATTVRMRITPKAWENGKMVIKTVKGTGITSADFSTNPSIVSDSLVFNITAGDTAIQFSATALADVEQEEFESVFFNVATLPNGIKKGNTASYQFTIIDNNQSTNTANINKNQGFFYPNPADQTIHLLEKANLTITNVNGRVMKEISNTTIVDISDLTAGVYLIRSSNGQSGKLIINR